MSRFIIEVGIRYGGDVKGLDLWCASTSGWQVRRGWCLLAFLQVREVLMSAFDVKWAFTFGLEAT